MTLTTEEGRHLANLAGRGYTKALSRLLGELVDQGALDLKSAAKARFSTVAALLADNKDKIGYSESGADTIVAAGDLVEVIDGQFAYSVRASDASDHHVATAGGVKLDVLAAPNGRISVTALGSTQAAVEKAFGLEVPILMDAAVTCTSFTVTGKTLDVLFVGSGQLTFAAANSNKLTLDGCSGRVEGIKIDSAGDSGGGVFASLRCDGCSSLTISRYDITSDDDLPVNIFDCDDTVAEDGVSRPKTTAEPYGGTVRSSARSGFRRCHASSVNLGYVILGVGYDDDGVTPPRTADQETGMFVEDCSIYDHTGHAFNINGAKARISRCIAHYYSGSVGNSSFQIKGSEAADALTVSGAIIEDCAAFECIEGFTCQNAFNPIFRNNRVYRAKRYGFTANNGDGFVLDNLYVEDWGLDSATWPALFSESDIHAVTISSTTDFGTISDLQIRINDDTNYANRGFVNILGDYCKLTSMKVDKAAGETDADKGITISGSYNHIGAGVRANSSTTPLTDSSSNTIYELTYAHILAFSTGASGTFINTPIGGLHVGRINTYLVSGTVTDHTYQVGRVGDNDMIVTSRTAATESIAPTATTLLTAGQRFQMFGTSTGGTINLQVIIGGIPAL